MVIRKEQQIEKEQRLLIAATDISGVEKILRSQVKDFEYGMDTAGGTIQNPAGQRRIIDRVLGQAQNANASDSNIMKIFHNFKDWAQINLRKSSTREDL